MPLSETSGNKLSYSANGPVTTLTNRSQDMSFTETVKIDDFVEKKSKDCNQFYQDGY